LHTNVWRRSAGKLRNKKGGEKKEKIPETWAFVVFNYVVDCPVCPSFLARHSGHLGANN